MQNKDQFFTRLALQFAAQSTCSRKQVGAILVKDGRIISTGYNGSISGFLHCCNIDIFKGVDWNNVPIDSELAEKHHLFSTKNEVHAEQNVIAFAAKNGVSTEGCSLYCTLAPCYDCSKLIVVSGIKEVFYLSEYDRNTESIDFLKKCGLFCKKISLTDL